MTDENEVEQVELDIETEKPYCKIHFCTMENKSRRGGKTYYRCKVKGCAEKMTIVRPELRIPTTPHICPKCDDGPALVVGKSQAYAVKMVCPVESCGYSLEVPRPDIEKRIARERRKGRDILD